MSDDEQRIAIAKACGWHDWRGIETAEGRIAAFGDVLPDYLNDLNAMAEAEESLDCSQSQKFSDHLERITTKHQGSLWKFYFAHATARQRAKAFLRTIRELK